MNRLASVFFICSVMVHAQEPVHTSTLTLGVGGLPYSDGAFGPQSGGPSFTGNYEFRLIRHLAVETGTDILLPSGVSFRELSVIPPGLNFFGYTPGSSCTSMCVLAASGRSQVTLLTYGFKGILPLAADRVELFAGIGGAYGWNSVRGPFDSAYGQGNAGARVAIDQGHRFWLGTTLRGFTSFGRPQQAWLPWTFDFGIRFGH